jgi:RHS repeat-associated protein
MLYRNDEETERFFYHPDHLGSSSFLTDANGDPTLILPPLLLEEKGLGDEVHWTIEQRATTDYYTPYTFSAKERDTETGYSYFGARYYDPNVSVWLSVDPMSDESSREERIVSRSKIPGSAASRNC